MLALLAKKKDWQGSHRLLTASPVAAGREPHGGSVRAHPRAARQRLLADRPRYRTNFAIGEMVALRSDPRRVDVVPVRALVAVRCTSRIDPCTAFCAGVNG